MFTETDVKRFLRKALKGFAYFMALLAIAQIGISFWRNWNMCSFHYYDKDYATKNECPTIKSEYLRRACHGARHGLSLSPLLCGTLDTIKDVHKIMWMDEIKTLIGNLWFGVLLAFGLGLAVLYCAMSRGVGGGGYPSVSVVYPDDVWMKRYQARIAGAQPCQSGVCFDRPGVTTPAKNS